ncbi:MAG: recombinase family protein [Prosthecobacter sp.]|nr:recombinase family protein [Prosthecobacter sp.]
MANLIGYARVSTGEQSADLQTDALTQAGCLRIFTDSASGKTASRPQLDRCLDFIRPGDTLVVWRLDRLGRSLKHLLAVMESLDERGVQFRSLTESLDTSTPGGRMLFSVFGAVAQFERELMIERTNAGLAAARERGRLGGRRRVMAAASVELAQQMRAEGKSMTEVATVLRVSRATVYRELERVTKK